MQSFALNTVSVRLQVLVHSLELTHMQCVVQRLNANFVLNDVVLKEVTEEWPLDLFDRTSQQLIPELISLAQLSCVTLLHWDTGGGLPDTHWRDPLGINLLLVQ